MTTTLAGFRTLFRAAFRHNALLMAPWIVLITAVPVASLLAYDSVFPTTLQRLLLTRSVAANPAFTLLFGSPLDLMTADGFAAWRSLALGSFFAGLMTILVVVRETRAREDSGVLELVLAAPVGRFTQLAVSLTIAWAAALMLGAVVAGACIVAGGQPLGSVLLGAAFASAGAMFAGVAALTSQLAAFAGRATALAMAVVAVSYIVRGLADASAATRWIAWLTPFGWIQKIAPTGANDGGPLLLCLAFTAACAAGAALLCARRDFGQGILSVRPGAPRAGAVGSLFGLAVRLQRDASLTWFATFVVFGAVSGFVVSSLGDVITGNVQIRAMLAVYGANVDVAFMIVALMLNVMAILAGVQGVGAMMLLAAEEARLRVDPLLAASTRRWRLLASHVLVAIVAPVFAMLLGAAAMAGVSRLAGSDLDAMKVVRQALLCLSAAWVLTALAVALVGALPRLRTLAWIAVALTFTLSVFGPQLGLWDWLLALSPLQHVPNLALGPADLRPALWLVAISAALGAVGFVGFARRDIGTG